jgi:hypothetical protein
LDASCIVLTQLVPHGIVPAGHVAPQTPFPQNVPGAQTVVQLPQ